MSPKMDIETLDKETILEDIERARQNRLWLTNRLDTIRDQYVNNFIAVDKGRVIAFDSDMKRLVSDLKRKYENISYIAIQYVPEEDYIIVI